MTTLSRATCIVKIATLESFQKKVRENNADFAAEIADMITDLTDDGFSVAEAMACIAEFAKN